MSYHNEPAIFLVIRTFIWDAMFTMKHLHVKAEIQKSRWVSVDVDMTDGI